VRFDDRLTTVLGHPASSPHDRAIRWRQLVELVARAPPDGDRDLVDRALESIRSERGRVDERVRVAAALAVTPFPLPVELVSAFAADGLPVAAPILAGARLTASEWKQVAAAASEDCRSFIAAMRSGPSESGSPPAQSEPGSIPSIGEVVARIERIRHSREDRPPSSPQLDGDSPRLFRWECNEAGEIDWVEGAPRGALVGQSIAHAGNGRGVNPPVERAFASRAPFHDGLLELPSDAKAGGRWKISGIPAFDRASGRFSGYRGIAERTAPDEPPRAAPEPGDPNSLRELAHEIRTPLNAIIGFAEIITGEYLGPANGRYRERANEIVAQARLLVEAIDDLDFAARMRSQPETERARIHLGELVEAMAPSLRSIAAGRGARIDATRATGDLSIAVEPELAQRLVLRLCTAIIGRASEGETLRLGVDCDPGECRVSMSRPAALQGLADAELFGTDEGALSDAFILRLVRGLARIAGAALVTSPGAIALSFPRG
jgi:hypothetical protein